MASLSQKATTFQVGYVLIRSEKNRTEKKVAFSHPLFPRKKAGMRNLPMKNGILKKVIRISAASCMLLGALFILLVGFWGVSVEIAAEADAPRLALWQNLLIMLGGSAIGATLIFGFGVPLVKWGWPEEEEGPDSTISENGEIS